MVDALTADEVHARAVLEREHPPSVALLLVDPGGTVKRLADERRGHRDGSAKTPFDYAMAVKGPGSWPPREGQDPAEVVTVHHGGDALMLLAVAPADVVLLDVEMPSVDGVTALRRIRAVYPQAGRRGHGRRGRRGGAVSGSHGWTPGEGYQRGSGGDLPSGPLGERCGRAARLARTGGTSAHRGARRGPRPGIETETASGYLMAGVEGIVAAHYCKVISEKTRDALCPAARHGAAHIPVGALRIQLHCEGAAGSRAKRTGDASRDRGARRSRACRLSRRP